MAGTPEAQTIKPKFHVIVNVNGEAHHYYTYARSHDQALLFVRRRHNLKMHREPGAYVKFEKIERIE